VLHVWQMRIWSKP